MCLTLFFDKESGCNGKKVVVKIELERSAKNSGCSHYCTASCRGMAGKKPENCI